MERTGEQEEGENRRKGVDIYISPAAYKNTGVPKI